MAISTYGVTLKWGTSESAVERKVDIKDFPDLGGSPEMLETTTLSDAVQTYILGIQSSDVMEFTANYTKQAYEDVLADANKELFYELEFGDNGSEGTFRWKGMHTVWVTGTGVNSVVDMKIGIAPSTKPELVATLP